MVGKVGIPFEAARENECLAVVATSYGGHLGWCQSASMGCGYANASAQNEDSWTEEVVMKWFETCCSQF